MRAVRDTVQFWGATESERRAAYPCEAHSPTPYRRFLRAVDVDADPVVAFRWVCQLKVAPYSYDLIDRLGRRSPRTLTPGADRLAVGQRFTIARIVEFDPGHHITAVSTSRASLLLGPIALTYRVNPRDTGSRIVVAITVTASSAAERLRREVLGWGDLVMMRKQLLTLKSLAERTRGPDADSVARGQDPSGSD